ncbi:caspase domain-containing protein [Kitasatospora sp. NPDC048365]|uniref:caspase family protein n=1 Tax=Kitasatospora sp. NPDC048365 TaxID=3364050 RepID=UPI003716F82E
MSPAATTTGRYALVVVVSNYGDPGLGALRAPVQDAAALVDVLADRTIGDFDVRVLADPSAQQLRLAVEDFFADRSPGDTLLLHFSCHGVKNVAGKLFLAATDTNRKRLASTAVPAEYVSGMMLASRAQRAVLVLDCCYAGAFERGMLTRADTEVHVQESFQDLERTGDLRGRAVFTASSAVEYAFEGDRPVADAPGAVAGPSLFTGALVKGLRTGEADQDGDGQIGVSELADYVGDQLREVSPHQTPQLWIFGARGDLPIARSRRRVTRATALPPEVVAAAHSASREQRLWAVDDLRGLLCGTDVGRALSAKDVLAELEQDDSRRVAEGAARALGSARPWITPATLDLGRAGSGAPRAPALLQVKGPPVARATMEALGPPWLQTRYVDEGVELTTDAAARGHLTGTLKLKTATGDLSLPVRAEAVTTLDPRPGPSRSRPDPRHPAPRQPAPSSAPPPAPRQARQAPQRTWLLPLVQQPASPQPSPPQPSPPQPSAPVPLPAEPSTTGVRPDPWPSALTLLAMVLTMVLPFYRDSDLENASLWIWTPGRWALPLYPWVGLLVLVTTLAATVTWGVIGVLVLRRAGAVRRPAVRWWGSATAALSAAAALLVWITAALHADPYFDILPGVIAFTAGAALQVWAAVELRRRPAPATGPPPPGAPARVLPVLPAAVFSVLAVVLPIATSHTQEGGVLDLLEYPSRYQLAAMAVLVGAVTCVATAVHLRRADPARTRWLPWWYSAAALMSVAAMILFWNDINADPGAGLFFLVVACACQLGGSVHLWLQHRARPG